jgi:hypothetical protein
MEENKVSENKVSEDKVSEDKDDNVDNLLDYMMRLSNINKEIKKKYFDCLSMFNTFVGYCIKHPFQLLPGFLMIQRIVNALNVNDYFKIYQIEVAACNNNTNISWRHPDDNIDDYKDEDDDGMIVLNSLRFTFGLQRSNVMYHKLFNLSTSLKTKIDIYHYLDTTLINRYLFTLNIETNIKDFCNRCSETNFLYLYSIVLFLKKHENDYEEKHLRKNINRENIKFSKGKKGFIYLFWISELHKKIVLPSPNQI